MTLPYKTFDFLRSTDTFGSPPGVHGIVDSIHLRSMHSFIAYAISIETKEPFQGIREEWFATFVGKDLPKQREILTSSFVFPGDILYIDPYFQDILSFHLPRDLVMWFKRDLTGLEIVCLRHFSLFFLLFFLFFLFLFFWNQLQDLVAWVFMGHDCSKAFPGS